MSTKQKLTLGIAAIFMVTLTIVGVTYAYFVTQVKGNGNATDVNVQTAKFGALEYVDGTGGKAVEFYNAFPGDTKTKGFAVKNTGTDGAEALNYKLTLEVTPNTTKEHQFFHTASTPDVEGTVVESCYTFDKTYDANATSDLTGDATPADCLKGEYFDNILVTVWESDSTYTAKTKKVDQVLLNVDGTYTTSRLRNNASYTITDTISIEAGDDNMHYYLLEVEYAESDKNQNYETEAALTIKPNITSVTAVVGS